MTGRAGGTLVVGPAWVGDMVMAQSLFIALKRDEPDAPVEVLAPGWTMPLLGYMPEVARGLVQPVGRGRLGLSVRWRLGRALEARGYDRAIVLPNSWKSALPPFAARIPRRTGYVGEMRRGLLNDARRLDKIRLPRTVDRFVALARPREAPMAAIEAPRLAVEPEQVDDALEALDMARPDAPVLALCPGAEYGPAKRWPAAHFAETAVVYRKRGWAVWLFGSPADREVAEEVDRAAGGGCVNLAGATSLGQAIALLSLAEAVVTNDSGLMHVAAALDRRQVAIFGSSSPGMTPPLSARATVVSLALPCSPCYQRECPLGHTDCLRQLTPETALRALEEPCAS
jgi:heptosyltransferase-2